MVPTLFAPRATARNGCAHAAAASLAVHHGLATDGPGLLSRLYPALPPDTPGRLLGTTPWRTAAIARRAGLEAQWGWAVRSGTALALLQRELAAGRPVIVLLNLRPLGHPWPVGHYAIVTGLTDEEVSLVNLPRSLAPRQPLAAFLRAWRIAALPLPTYRYAWVTVSSGAGFPLQAAAPCAAQSPA
ncbi:MAG TPA: hypothetical protein VNZ52_09905 [Candidatus Thermoplasmatota archaeon]|nr:hypothetical protein [Candidatus Thermoplasmatota archaeon]